MAATWDRLQAARGALSAAYARYTRAPTPANRALLLDARRADAHAEAEYARLCRAQQEAAELG